MAKNKIACFAGKFNFLTCRDEFRLLFGFDGSAALSLNARVLTQRVNAQVGGLISVRYYKTIVGFDLNAYALVTGNDRYTYWAGLIAVVVLIYCYPGRRSWTRTLQMFVPANQ